MQTETASTSKFSLGVYFVGIAGALLIVLILIAAMNSRNRAPAISAARSAERLKARQELDAAGTAMLNEYSWVDQGKGIVRIPIGTAMEMLQRDWKNPAAGRSNLLARLEKATAVPPKAPEKPSPFE
jgi:hypothetical protein